MYLAWVETHATINDSCARIEPCAFPKPSTLLRDESPRDIKCNLRSKELSHPLPRAVVDPHERSACVLAAQNDVNEAANKAADDEVEAEATF